MGSQTIGCEVSKRVRQAILLAILLLAAVLRLTRLGLTEFKFDEATTARSALAIAREGALPALGMVSSRGPYNPPLMSYLLAPPFALSRDPRLASGWIAFLGVAAVGLTYWLGSSTFGWPVGAIAALLFATAPWAVFHSRKIWAQNVPALTLLFIIASMAFVVRRQRWALAGAFAAAACLVGLHLGGLAFFIMLPLLMTLFWRRVRLWPAVVGAALVLIILGPYLLYDARHAWTNARAFLAMGSESGAFDLQALRMAGIIGSGWGLEALAGERHADFLASIVNLRWLDGVEIALFWAGLLWLVARVIRGTILQRGHPSHGTAARLVLLCWFSVPVALMLHHAEPIQPHALSMLYPVQHLIVALLLTDVARLASKRFGLRAGRWLFSLAAALAVLIAGWQIYAQEVLLTYIDERPTPGGYGAPLKDSLAAAGRVEALAQAQAEEAEEGEAAIVAVLPGGEPRFDGQAAVFDVLLPAGSRIVDGRQALLFPQKSASYLVDTSDVGNAALRLLATEASEARPPLAMRTGSEEVYRFFIHSGDAPAIPHLIEDDPIHWASGATLLGYDGAGEVAPGGTLHWTLYWRVDGLPPEGSDIHWFNQLIDEQGTQWGQADGTGFPSASWRSGDCVAAWFDITISEEAPPPPYYVRVGQYTYPDVVNVQILDVAGNPAGEYRELGPVHAGP